MQKEFLFPSQLLEKESLLKSSFLANVNLVPEGDRIKQCLQCGTCSGSCPVSQAMDISPRQIIAFFRSGEIQKVLNSESIWLCVSCYSCQTRCPQKIKITEIIYSLKQTAIQNKIFSKTIKVHALRDSFLKMLNEYGRLNETLLMIRYILKTNPLKGIAFLPLAVKLSIKGRLVFKSNKIKNRKALKNIIAKSKKIEIPIQKYKPPYIDEAVGYKAVS